MVDNVTIYNNDYSNKCQNPKFNRQHERMLKTQGSGLG